MATDNILRTFTDNSVVTDVLDMVELLSPAEDTLFRMLGRSVAKANLHQWQVETLPSSDGASEEAAPFSAGASTTPTRSVNITEFIKADKSLTDRERASSHYGVADMLAHQKELAMKAWRNNAEAEILRGSMVSGASGTASQMAGIINCISTNATAHSSGTVFNQSILDGLLGIAWENGNGEPVTDVLVGSLMKRRISGFSGRSGTQFVIPANTEQLITTTSKYTSDFGDLTVHLHRYMQKDFSGNSDATARVLGINREKFRLAYLITPKMEEFARRGASYDFRCSGDLTVESLNERTAFFASGFLLAA